MGEPIKRDQQGAHRPRSVNGEDRQLNGPFALTLQVWIHSGRLHLVPLSHVSPPSKPRKYPRIPGGQDEDHFAVHEEAEYIAMEDALSLVRDASVDTFAPNAVEDIVWQRISGYPGVARNHVHTTLAYLPVDIARALTVDQSLVQKPIETFYTRDALQLRVRVGTTFSGTS